MTIYQVNPIALPDESPVARKPPRPRKCRDNGYSEKFDYETLFYDVFYSRGAIVTVGPPARNLARYIRRELRWEDGRRVSRRVYKMDRAERSVILPRGMSLKLRASGSIELSNDESSAFAGRRVILTMSKDNPVNWIRDWAEFYVVNHATDAVLLFDNCSSKYSANDIEAALADVEGLKAVGIVEWPFKYGPQGGRGSKWDSDFSQSGMFDVAWNRFLSRAASVINVDIDELALPASGGLHSQVERSDSAVLLFDGRWISANDVYAGSDFVFASYPYLEADGASCPPKWAAVPDRLGRRSQLSVHGARRVARISKTDVEYRHFRGVNTGWKYDRKSLSRTTNLTVDADLALAVQRTIRKRERRE